MIMWLAEKNEVFLRVTTSTAWKVSKYGAFYGPYSPTFSPNAGKYGPEKTPYLETFHAVCLSLKRWIY